MQFLPQTVEQIFNSNAAYFFELSPLALFFVFFFATFISEDAACLAAGALAGSGKISFALALTACFAGIFVGDVLLYWTGRIFGKRISETKIFRRFVSENAILKASSWLEKRGAWAVFLSRFVTGLRLPTYLAAGFLRTDFLKFALYFLLASAIWTPILVGSTAFSQKFFFSNNLLFGIILMFIALKIFLHFLSWKNRRLFVGRLKKIKNWEFWSLKIFYFPVVLYIFFLAIKYRSLTVFTAANPAISAGGFIGESKHGIYENLKNSSDYLLQYIFLDGKISLPEKTNQSREFIAKNNLTFPLVLKPDAGERGKGVKIVKTFIELESELEKIRQDFILQEFAEGTEASVFYYRLPNEKKGRIFSITEKRFPAMIGDGEADLETLILRDKRAVYLAHSYFEQNREQLNFVPAKGEEFQIINIGTHSRGAIFLDGDRLRTEKLEKKIDEICRRFEGFYFGRFDIRAKSLNDLQRGENFKIIELNGVTSESTNIYDPKFSLFDAYKILFSQWRIAFEIGAQNAENNFRPTTVFQLVRLIAENCFGFKKQSKSANLESEIKQCV